MAWASHERQRLFSIVFYLSFVRAFFVLDFLRGGKGLFLPAHQRQVVKALLFFLV